MDCSWCRAGTEKDASRHEQCGHRQAGKRCRSARSQAVALRHGTCNSRRGQPAAWRQRGILVFRTRCAIDSLTTNMCGTGDREREIPVPRTRHRRLDVPTLVLLISLVAADPSVAQSGTPAAYPMAPDPSECVVEPAAIEEIAAILATPGAGPTDTAATFVPPNGTPADAETSAAVNATLRQVFACANAGDPLRVASLFSDDFLRDFFGGAPREDLLDFLTTPPQPLPEDQKRIIVRFGEVQLLPDGRTGVVIVLAEPDDPRTEEPDFAIMKRVEGRWLVDKNYEDGGTTSTEATGTPAA